MEAHFTDNLEGMIFDFEGTLVDFQWKLSEAVENALEKLWEMGFTRDRIGSRKYSTLLIEAVQAAPEIGLQPEYVCDTIGRIYDSYDEDALTRWNLRPGVKDFLRALKKRGIQAALVSNIGGKTIAKALSKFGLESFFDIALSRNDVPNLKPSPDGINLALQRMGTRKDRTIFVGDSLDDVNAARNAGLKVIIITNGENLGQEILAARPNGVFETYKDLRRTM
ncbi:MAG: HAD family hydrolase [Syntrophobacteraceae bacterium]